MLHCFSVAVKSTLTKSDFLKRLFWLMVQDRESVLAERHGNRQKSQGVCIFNHGQKAKRMYQEWGKAVNPQSLPSVMCLLQQGCTQEVWNLRKQCHPQSNDYSNAGHFSFNHSNHHHGCIFFFFLPFYDQLKSSHVEHRQADLKCISLALSCGIIAQSPHSPRCVPLLN